MVLIILIVIVILFTICIAVVLNQSGVPEIEELPTVNKCPGLREPSGINLPLDCSLTVTKYSLFSAKSIYEKLVS